MEKIISTATFSYKNGELYVVIIESGKRYRLNEEGINRFLELVTKERNKLSTPHIRGDNFYISYDGGIIGLKNYSAFRNDDRFKVLFEKFDKKNLILATTKEAASFIVKLGVAGAIFITGVLCLGLLREKMGLEDDELHDPWGNPPASSSDEFSNFYIQEIPDEGDIPWYRQGPSDEETRIVSAAQPQFDSNSSYVDSEPIVTNQEIETKKVTDEIREKLGFDDYTDSDKAKNTREKYYDLIKYYANMYNLNPDLLCALATQERGVHSTEIDSDGALGLMQLQVNVWEGETISVYNHSTQQFENITLHANEFSNLVTNVKDGCAVFRYHFNQMYSYLYEEAKSTARGTSREAIELRFEELIKERGKEIVGLMAYNRGPDGAKEIITRYANSIGKTYEEVMNDPNDFGWLDFEKSETDIRGDEEYTPNVMRYFGGRMNDVGVSKDCRRDNYNVKS